MSHKLNRGEWIPWEQSGTPFLLSLTLAAGMEGLRAIVGLPLWTTIIIFEGGQAQWLFRPQELKALGLRMIDYLLCPSLRIRYEADFDTAERLVVTEARRIQFETQLSQLTNQQLLECFAQLRNYYYNWYALAWFCEPIQFQAQDVLNNYLLTANVGEDFGMDSAAVKRTLLSLEEYSFIVSILADLRECAAALKECVTSGTFPVAVTSAVLNHNHELAAQDLIEWATTDVHGHDLLHRLNEHCSKFYWKRNSYSATVVLKPLDILVEVLSENGLDLDNTIDRLARDIQNAKEERSHTRSIKPLLMERLPLHLREVVALANSVGGILLDRRKRSIMIANGAFDSILSEAARRTERNIADVRFLLPQEVEFYLSNSSDYDSRFADRRKLFVVFQSDVPVLAELLDSLSAISGPLRMPAFPEIVMRDPFIAEGEDAEGILVRLSSTYAFLIEGNEEQDTQILQGVVAYAAEADFIEGRVAIIRDPARQRLHQGDVLVASSTTPDFMDAIRRCSAIVTDWGGHTSHAAIVARELHKPCIIGTAFASHILRDGERVRLNMKTGGVERLEADLGSI